MDEQKILKNFGFNFKIQRMKLGFSQDYVVEKTGFSKSYVSNVESAKHRISLINALILANIVNKSIEELIVDI